MDSLRNAILKEFPDAKVTDAVSKTKGAFEISVNGKLVFSRIKSSSYPDSDKIVNILRDVQAGKPIPVIQEIQAC